jgi:hypothetical protein
MDTNDDGMPNATCSDAVDTDDGLPNATGWDYQLSTESGADTTTSSDAVDTDGDGKPDASSGIISLQEINVNIWFLYHFSLETLFLIIFLIH